MSEEYYIDIDTTYRDRKLYPNQSDIKVERSNQPRNISNARNIICDNFNNKNIIKSNSKFGSVYNIKIENIGDGYDELEEVKVIGGDNNCILQLNKVSLKIINPGSGYLPGIYNVSGKGYGCNINILQVGTSIDIIQENGVFCFREDYKNFFLYTNFETFPILEKFNNIIIIKNYVEIKKDSIFSIHEFKEDGVKDLKPFRNKNETYNISLINLLIPNKKLVSGTVCDYPYVFVEFYSGSNRLTSHYQSNNPYMDRVSFKCIINETNSKFVRLCGINSIKKVFNMGEDVTLKVLLPNGEVLKYFDKDNDLPQRPNNDLQINAIFYLKN